MEMKNNLAALTHIQPYWTKYFEFRLNLKLIRASILLNNSLSRPLSLQIMNFTVFNCLSYSMYTYWFQLN